MRIGLLAAAVALLGTACYTESPRHRVVERERYVEPAEFDAYTTSGEYVRVAQDRRTGDLIVVSPGEMHGARVGLVSDNGGTGGAPLVTTDIRQHRVVVHEGSGGDRYERPYDR